MSTRLLISWSSSAWTSVGASARSYRAHSLVRAQRSDDDGLEIHRFVSEGHQAAIIA